MLDKDNPDAPVLEFSADSVANVAVLIEAGISVVHDIDKLERLEEVGISELDFSNIVEGKSSDDDTMALEEVELTILICLLVIEDESLKDFERIVDVVNSELLEGSKLEENVIDCDSMVLEMVGSTVLDCSATVEDNASNEVVIVVEVVGSTL